MLKNILFVGLGGATGSILRYLIAIYIQKIFSGAFPLATFLVNVLGCFLVGILFGLFDNQTINHPIKLFAIIGFCGGFTTFSSFSHENMYLMQSGNYFCALAYTAASIVLGFVAVWAGLMISK